MCHIIAQEGVNKVVCAGFLKTIKKFMRYSWDELLELRSHGKETLYI